MFGMSLVDKFKSLDVYRKLPPDFVKPTYSGAMLSIISSILMILLFLNEFAYSSQNTLSLVKNVAALDSQYTAH